MTLSKILSNVKYNIRNRSNYSITEEETRGIVDVPYFPAQNLVDVTDSINAYKPNGIPIPFLDDNGLDRLFYLISRTDARFIFTELADDARYYHYAFIGNSFPQTRENFSYTINGSKLYIYGGEANGRCLNDLWQYDINSNSWTNLNFTEEENSVNVSPSRRRKSSCLVVGDTFWVFGGETDILTINSSEDRSIIAVNDLWSFDLNTKIWTNYDLNRIFPHRQGNIIYVDSAVVKILIGSGVNTIGQEEPTAIWTLDLATDTVEYEEITTQFEALYLNVLMSIDGIINVQTDSNLYEWNNESSAFTLVKEGITCINPQNKKYWIVLEEEKNFGDNVNMEIFNISEGNLYSFDDVLLSVKTITLPPIGEQIPNVNIDNMQTFFYGGLVTLGKFNESTYLMNHTTLSVEKLDFDSDERPTERTFTSLTYDRYRGRIWLFGGSDGTKFYNDLWYFDLGLKEWIKVHSTLENTNVENPMYPQPRFKSGLCVVATNYLYLLGGYSDVASFNDFWSYNIIDGSWIKLFSVDDIPWGSTYEIFEWRDRLWMFNGQKLYRYFFGKKQFVYVPFLITKTEDNDTDDKVNKGIEAIINAKSYLETPIVVTVVNGKMFVQNPQVSFDVELENKVVTDLKLQFGLADRVLWMDRYWGINNGTLSACFVNVSGLQPLTKNQIPNSNYSYDLAKVCPAGIFFQDYGNSWAASKCVYQDNAGTFRVQDRTEELDKAELIVNNRVSFVAKQSEYPEFNFNNVETLWDKTLEIVVDPKCYPYAPWFYYEGFQVIGGNSLLKGAQKLVLNENLGRVYVIYNNGNTLKINPEDGTFFTYFTSLWAGSAIGYNKNRNTFYAFGGLRIDEDGNSLRPPYMQNGLEAAPILIEGEKNTREEASHPGLMQFDMSINEMNLGSVENYLRDKDATSVDYAQTKEFLTTLISKYIENSSANILPGGLDEAKAKIYEATQPILDDMSQFDFAFENGERPLGRTYSLSTQIGNTLYIFGGCESYTDTCFNIQQPEPFHCTQPGSLINQKILKADSEAEPIYDTYEQARKAFAFNMESKTWTELTPMHKWSYLGSAIADPTERFIYLVGGFSGMDCTSISSNITIYDTMTDTYEDILGIPKTYAPRAKPILQWLDTEKLLIMYGFRTLNVPIENEVCSEMKYFHIPISDAWIYDISNKIMYRAFEDLNSFGAIVIKDDYCVDDLQQASENSAYVLSPIPLQNDIGETILRVSKWNLVNGTVDTLPIIASNEIINDYSLATGASFDPIEDSLNSMVGDSNIPKTIQEMMDYRIRNSNFRFRYAWTEEFGTHNHKHMFVIGERSDESGIDAIEAVARGYTEAHLRFWYVDIDLPAAGRILRNITYEYPLAISPVALAYDGKQYIYCVYNKYNIWRLDFKKVLKDSSGSWWYQLPPCIDCNFLGDSRTDPIWDTFFMEPNYLALISRTGKMARMDLNTFSWFLDKAEAPQDSTAISLGIIDDRGNENPKEYVKACSGVDGQECYLYELGGIAGKVMNVYERQWDNFYFDMRLTSMASKQFGSLVNQKLWPAVLKRKRLYTMNHVGHLFYSWLRIDGIYDVEFQLDEFVEVEQIRIYGDYNLVENYENLEITFFDIATGWVTVNVGDLTPIVSEIDWDWDGASSRRYIRMFANESGNTTYQYSTQPPNYVLIDLISIFGTSKPMSKVRVYFKNPTKPYNFFSRINKIELLTEQATVAAYDSSSGIVPLDVIYLQPLETHEDYSNAFGVTIKNNNSEPVKKVVAYVFDNDWLQFTLNPDDDNSWGLKTESIPLEITDELSAGDQIQFYVRAINIDSRPHTKDLVVSGIFPYEG